MFMAWRTVRSGPMPLLLSLVSSVMGVQGFAASAQPLMVVRLEGLAFCQMRNVWSTNRWCMKKTGSPTDADTSAMTAPIPLWP